jgi:hypothetical protein
VSDDILNAFKTSSLACNGDEMIMRGLLGGSLTGAGHAAAPGDRRRDN